MEALIIASDAFKRITEDRRLVPKPAIRRARLRKKRQECAHDFGVRCSLDGLHSRCRGRAQPSHVSATIAAGNAATLTAHYANQQPAIEILRAYGVVK